MNLLTVLASGKQGLREEVMSVLLGYLLSPEMNHGLGTLVLKETIASLIDNEKLVELSELQSVLNMKFRSNPFFDKENEFKIELEVAYPSINGSIGYIDIVLAINNWYILIENKIKNSSITKDQVKDQYIGFRKILEEKSITDKKILLIYLVPGIVTDSGWQISQVCEEEAKGFINNDDVSTTVYWNTIADVKRTCLSDVFKNILIKESCGDIEPISWDTRQLLLSIINFSQNEFSGYSYERVISKGNSEKMKLLDIFDLSENIYVGIKNGMAGLIRQSWRKSESINNYYSTSTTPKGWQYINSSDAKKIFKWAVDGDCEGINEITWSGKPFFTDILYLIGQSLGDNIFIGIKGGLDALKNMNNDDILKRPGWEIANTKKSNQWFSGKQYVEVLKEKGIIFDKPNK